MQNISGRKFFWGAAFLFCFAVLRLPASAASNSLENLGKAVVEKYQETSAPLFKPDEPEVKEKPKSDPFFDKIRKKNMKFTKEEQKKRREFIEKVREKNWPDEKKQQKLADFQKKELERRKKFIEKQQEKIQKHQEEGS